jgi:site-specific DNA-methyltransferase (cytosine-N4-specific)
VYDTSEVARLIGVSKQTLLRWIRTGLVDDVRRDQRGWRVWEDEDVARVRRFQESYHGTESAGELRAVSRPDWVASLGRHRSRRTREAER